jgi:hypothetical protein
MAVNRTSKARGKVLDIPANAPTIGTPTDAGDGFTANVAFTAPSTSTGGPIFSYTAVSSPGSFTATTTSTSTVAVTGLTAGTAYTFTVKANNPTGSGPASSASTSLTIVQPVDFYSIATYTISNTTTRTVTFSSIPQTYKHLQLRIHGRARRAVDVESGAIYYNGDSGINYRCHLVSGNGSAASTGTAANDFVTMMVTGSLSTTGIFSATIADIFDYTNASVYKTQRSLTGYDGNGAGYTRMVSQLYYANTNAITSISLDDGGGSSNWEVGSHIALYGIKG